MYLNKIICFICLFFLCNTIQAQTVNSKVSMVGTDGKNYTGVITAIQADKYNVKYDGINFSAWLTANQFTVASAANAVQNRVVTNRGVSRFDVKLTDAQNAAIPEVKAGLPVLSGTYWAVISIYEKGTTPKTQFRPSNYLFCKNGNWEHQTGTLYLGGKYKVNGNVLTTDDGAGTKPSTWKITWDGSVKEMEMQQGTLIFVLRYLGKPTC